MSTVATAIMSESIYSTPRHENNEDPTVIIPSTPNKKTKSFELHLDETLMTPSKSFRCDKKPKFIQYRRKHRLNSGSINNNNNISNTTISTPTTTNTAETRKIPILSPIPTEPRKVRLMIDNFDDILGSKLNNDDLYSPLSDLESISPLSDISSCSPCIELKKTMDFNSIPSLPWNPNGRLLNQRDETYPLNNIVSSTLIKLQEHKNDQLINKDNKMFLLDLPPLPNKIKNKSVTLKKQSSIPQHRVKTPMKPIIRNGSKSLNLIVSSGNGSLDDATIYATEINASATTPTASSSDCNNNNNNNNNNGNQIPIIKTIWERVTIPVNHEIKERHKRLRSSYFGEFYNLDEKIDTQKANDYALIRGYEYDINSITSDDTLNQDKKSVRWNIPLHH